MEVIVLRDCSAPTGLLDEMYPPMLADALHDKGHDVLAIAASAELVGSDDATVLDVATGDGRCLVTENVRDFAMLVRHTSHAGVLFVHARRAADSARPAQARRRPA